MTDKENFQNILDDIFGKGTIKIVIDSNSNNIIRALNNKNNFDGFKHKFIQRLKRLNERFKNTEDYSKLCNKVKNISDKNWVGAFSELCVYDILKNEYLCSEIKLDQKLSNDESYSKEVGVNITDEDGLIIDYNIYFDVKSLKSTNEEKLKKIIENTLKENQQSVKCSIIPQYPLDDDSEYDVNLLSKELSEFLSQTNCIKNESRVFRSKIINGLQYNCVWGRNINSAIFEDNPYALAHAYKDMLFNKSYVKKS